MKMKKKVKNESENESTEKKKNKKPSLGKKKDKKAKPALMKKKAKPSQDEESSDEEKSKKPKLKKKDKDKSGKKDKPKRNGKKQDGSGEPTRYATQTPPKPGEATPEKMDRQREHLIKLGFLKKGTKTLKGLKLVKRHDDTKYIIIAKSNGWLLKNTGDIYAGLYGVVCAIVGKTRPAYPFLQESFEAVK